MNKADQLSGLLAFYFTATNWRKLHSPYLFSLFSFLFDNERRYYVFEALEKKREELLKDNSPLAEMDFGAGTKSGERSNRTVSSIAQTSLSSRGHCALRFRLAQFLKPEKILELGCSLGLSTAYLAASNRRSKVFALDGNTVLLEKAKCLAGSLDLNNIEFIDGQFKEKLPGVLDRAGSLDLVIIDGDHRRDATVRNVRTILPYVSQEAVVLIDDIRWSQGMYDAWKDISGLPEVRVSVDLYRYGLLFFRREFREKLRLRILSSTFRPWEYF